MNDSEPMDSVTLAECQKSCQGDQQRISWPIC